MNISKLHKSLLLLVAATTLSSQVSAMDDGGLGILEASKLLQAEQAAELAAKEAAKGFFTKTAEYAAAHPYKSTGLVLGALTATGVAAYGAKKLYNNYQAKSLGKGKAPGLFSRKPVKIGTSVVGIGAVSATGYYFRKPVINGIKTGVQSAATKAVEFAGKHPYVTKGTAGVLGAAGLTGLGIAAYRNRETLKPYATKKNAAVAATSVALGGSALAANKYYFGYTLAGAQSLASQGFQLVKEHPVLATAAVATVGAAATTAGVVYYGYNNIINSIGQIKSKPSVTIEGDDNQDGIGKGKQKNTPTPKQRQHASPFNKPQITTRSNTTTQPVRQVLSSAKQQAQETLQEILSKLDTYKNNSDMNIAIAQLESLKPLLLADDLAGCNEAIAVLKAQL